MKNIIIGTAGHVDHGKTTLIRALTGIDTDRLKEEKKRGISIDLGFAHIKLTSELTASIVDVPGHEKFLKNMLAGTGGIDIALLVIAADEGVMPQTLEHLAMLELLGINKAIVVVNKIDKVDSEWLELIEDDIAKMLVGTSFSAAPFCRISATTGEGLPDFRLQLVNQAEAVASRDYNKPFRLWIDRSFIAKGYGSVVTGSILSGSVTVGEQLILYPDGQEVRVRGIEVHSNKVAIAYAGQRAALNISGPNDEKIIRGMALSAPCRGEISLEWDILAEWIKPIESGTRVRLHIGTGEYIGRVYKFRECPLEYMRVVLENPLAAGAGDRGIVRLYSPQDLLGGVLLISPSQRVKNISPTKRQLADALKSGQADSIVYCILANEGRLLEYEELCRRCGYLNSADIGQALKALREKDLIKAFDSQYITSDRFEKVARQIIEWLSDYHLRHPEQSGMSKETVRQKLNTAGKTIEIYLEALVNERKIILSGPYIATPEHSEKWHSVMGKVEQQAEELFRSDEFINIDLTIISQKFNVSVDKAQVYFDHLIRQNQLIEIGGMYVYSKTIQYMIGKVAQHFKEKSTLTIAELRDMLNTTRKLALPAAEFLDVHKYTKREGEIRRPGTGIRDLSENIIL